MRTLFHIVKEEFTPYTSPLLDSINKLESEGFKYKSIRPDGVLVYKRGGETKLIDKMSRIHDNLKYSQMKELLEIQYSIHNGHLFTFVEEPCRQIIFETEEEANDFRLVEEMITRRENEGCDVIVRLKTVNLMRFSPPIQRKEADVVVDVESMSQWRKPKFKEKQYGQTKS